MCERRIFTILAVTLLVCICFSTTDGLTCGCGGYGNTQCTAGTCTGDGCMNGTSSEKGKYNFWGCYESKSAQKNPCGGNRCITKQISADGVTSFAQRVCCCQNGDLCNRAAAVDERLTCRCSAGIGNPRCTAATGHTCTGSGCVNATSEKGIANYWGCYESTSAQKNPCGGNRCITKQVSSDGVTTFAEKLCCCQNGDLCNGSGAAAVGGQSYIMATAAGCLMQLLVTMATA